MTQVQHHQASFGVSGGKNQKRQHLFTPQVVVCYHSPPREIWGAALRTNIFTGKIDRKRGRMLEDGDRYFAGKTKPVHAVLETMKVPRGIQNWCRRVRTFPVLRYCCWRYTTSMLLLRNTLDFWIWVYKCWLFNNFFLELIYKISF